MSARRLVEVAARAVGTVSRNIEGTMTFLRPRSSAIIPMGGAVRAVARMVALTVKLTSNSEARRRPCKRELTPSNLRP